MPQRNLHFTGREERLTALRQGLIDKEATVLTQAISGLGGVGKTQLALEYSYRYASQYVLVCWVRAENTLLTVTIECRGQKLSHPPIRREKYSSF
jgi:predicted ATP-dependent serine protease